MRKLSEIPKLRTDTGLPLVSLNAIGDVTFSRIVRLYSKEYKSEAKWWHDVRPRSNVFFFKILGFPMHSDGDSINFLLLFFFNAILIVWHINSKARCSPHNF